MSIIMAPLVALFTVRACRVLCYNPQNLRSAFKNTHRLWKNVLLVSFSYIFALPSICRTIRYTRANTYRWINVFIHIYMQTHKDTPINLFPKKIKHIQDILGFIIPYFFFSCMVFFNKSLKAEPLHGRGRGKGRAMHTLGNWATRIALVKPRTRCRDCRLQIYCVWWKKHGDREVRGICSHRKWSYRSFHWV